MCPLVERNFSALDDVIDIVVVKVTFFLPQSQLMICFSEVVVCFMQGWRMTCADSSSFSRGGKKDMAHAVQETIAGNAMYVLGCRA